jgi:hypothetical protein
MEVQSNLFARSSEITIITRAILNRYNRTPATLYLSRHLPRNFVSAGFPVGDGYFEPEGMTCHRSNWALEVMRVSFLGSNLAIPVCIRDSAKLFLWDVLEGRVFKNELPTADDV